MSKTDKTRPNWVRILDPLDRAMPLVEIHDHTRTGCTLPNLHNVVPGMLSGSWVWLFGDELGVPGGGCGITMRYVGVDWCACRACQRFAESWGDPWRPKRRAARRQTRDWVREYNTYGSLDDYDDEDVVW